MGENVALCGELHQVGGDLDKSRLHEEELQVNWRGASSVFSRQKIVVENLRKSMQHHGRSDLQRMTESTNQLSELRSVHSQLDFALALQSQALVQSENKTGARTRRIRKL